jgi:flagellar protein FliO/FliZ
MKTLVLLKNTTEEAIVKGLNEKTAEAAPEKFSSFNNIFQLLGLVLLLVIILFAAYYTSKFIGKMKLGQLKNSNFDVIDSYRISQGKLLQIVKIGKKYVVISIGKENVNYITELDETDLVFKETVPNGKSTQKQSFRQIIDSMRKV